jgi:hypothetical protein
MVSTRPTFIENMSCAEICRSFLGQVPIAITCCVLMVRGLQVFSSETKGQDNARLDESQIEYQKAVLVFDYPGAITLSIWITSFLLIIDLQQHLSWGHPLILSVIIVGTTSFSVFMILETYPGNRQLLIPLRLLKTEVGAFCAGQVSSLTFGDDSSSDNPFESQSKIYLSCNIYLVVEHDY